MRPGSGEIRASATSASCKELDNTFGSRKPSAPSDLKLKDGSQAGLTFRSKF